MNEQSQGALKSGWRAAGICHGVTLCSLAYVCIILTRREVNDPSPVCHDWVCIDFAGLLPSLAWSFVGSLFILGLFPIFATRWSGGQRWLAYAGAVVASAVLAIPLGMFASKSLGGELKAARSDRMGAALASSVDLRDWSYSVRADGQIDVQVRIFTTYDGAIAFTAISEECSPGTTQADEASMSESKTLVSTIRCPASTTRPPNRLELRLATNSGSDPGPQRQEAFVTFSESLAPVATGVQKGGFVTRPLPPAIAWPDMR